MIPIYRILSQWPAVADIVGTRITREWGGDAAWAPYVVWGLLSGNPHNHLSGTPPSDRYSVSVDCFSTTEQESDNLIRACRDAFEQQGHQVNIIQSLGREADSKLWRYSMDVDIFRNRIEE